MKAFYTILLLISMVIFTDAQSDTSKSDMEHVINSASDTTKVNLPDSIQSSERDSLKKVNIDSSAIVKPKTLTGIASFYSRSFEGTKTATGAIFHQADYTAASNNFKLNTWVRVTNLRNEKSVIVLINDRMHPAMAKKGRIVDLTTTAAKQIGLTSKTGITKVKVEQVVKGTTE